jgi:hypothetical protein
MRGLRIGLVVVALASLAAAAQAQTDVLSDLRRQVQTLQEQLQAVTAKLKELETQSAAPAAPAPAAKSSWADKLSLAGYVHLRYEARHKAVGRFPNGPYVDWPTAVTTPPDDFSVRRLYLYLMANPNPRTKLTAVLRRLGGSPQVIELEGAFVEYALSDLYTLELGRVYSKFCWDSWESSSKRLVFDRFAAVEGIGAAGLRGLYAGGPTDNGLYLSRKPNGAWEPRAYLGFVNGNFFDPENNSNKTYTVDLKWDRGDWHWGASWLDGTLTETSANPAPPPASSTATYDRSMLGLYLRKDPAPWGIQGEWVDGELYGYDVNGWYGQASCLVGQGTAYARYEEYDPTDTSALTGDLFHTWRLGYALQLDKNNEFTVEWTPARRGGTDVGQFGVQWQTVY